MDCAGMRAWMHEGPGSSRPFFIADAIDPAATGRPVHVPQQLTPFTGVKPHATNP
jgi:hypothetical protein